MTEKAKRIENALDALNLQGQDFFTVSQLENVARKAHVTVYELMAYLRLKGR